MSLKRLPQLKKLAHLSDVVDVVRHLRRQPEEDGGQTVSEPPKQPNHKQSTNLKKSTDLQLDLNCAPQRPAASAPSRLGPGNDFSGGGAKDSGQPPDFGRATCWVGNLRIADASEEKLKSILKGCGTVRSVVVRQKPDKHIAGGSVQGKSWGFVTFLRSEGRDRAVAASGSVLGTGGYPLKVELLCMDDALYSDGELKAVWQRAKDKAHETTTWDRSHSTQLELPRPKRRRHSLPGEFIHDHEVESEDDPSAGQMARALSKAGKIDDISEVTKEAFLAKGTSGAVFRAQWNGMKVAAKFFTMMDDPKVMEAFRQELEVMRSLQHINLLRVYGYCMNPSSPCLVTELMRGSLDQLLWGSQSSVAPKLRELQQLKIMDGIAAGIAFLHKNGVLYNRDLTMKLCDFAFSKWKQAGTEQVMSSAVGTPAWMAPEILRGGEYNFKADVYSFGVILWEVLARKQPFKDLNAFAISYQVGTQGKLLPIEDIDSTSSNAGQITQVDSGSLTAECSGSQKVGECERLGSTTQHLNSERHSGSWWKPLLQNCFREAGDRPTLDQIIALLREAIAKSRPPVPARVVAQAPAPRERVAATHSEATTTSAQSEQTVPQAGSARCVSMSAPT